MYLFPLEIFMLLPRDRYSVSYCITANQTGIYFSELPQWLRNRRYQVIVRFYLKAKIKVILFLCQFSNGKHLICTLLIKKFWLLLIKFRVNFLFTLYAFKLILCVLHFFKMINQISQTTFININDF